MKLFVIILRYIASIEKINAARPAHLEFLDKYYAAGNFIVSGRQNPVTGGIIMASGDDRQEIENIVQVDPFYSEKLAEFNIYEFTPNKCAKDTNCFEKFIKNQ